MFMDIFFFQLLRYSINMVTLAAYIVLSTLGGDGTSLYRGKMIMFPKFYKKN